MACLDQIATAAFMCAGQRCTAVSRVLVNRASAAGFYTTEHSVYIQYR